MIAPATADVGRLAFIQEEHPQDLETLRGRLGLHPRSAGDFFDALPTLKFLEGRDGRYYSTASTAFFEAQNPRPSLSKLNWLFGFSQGFANSLDTLAQLKHF